MGTIRQKKLAKAIVDNTNAVKPLNKGQLVESVGYSLLSSEKKPGEIIDSKGTQFELKKLGFNEETAKDVVLEILVAGSDDGVRLNAAKEVFKVMGSYAAEKTFNLTVSSSVEEINEVIKKDLAKFRANQ